MIKKVFLENKKKVLVVDDEKNTREVIKLDLEGSGFKVKSVSSGPNALKELRINPEYDLVLIDFFMPSMSGRELLETIRKDAELKKLRCAFLTSANFSKKGLIELKKLKVLDYITKPFLKDDLINRVKKAIQ